MDGHRLAMIAAYGEDYESLSSEERMARLVERENRNRPKPVVVPDLMPPPPRHDEMHLWIGPRIRHARAWALISQAKLARAAGMSQAAISRIETGLKSPTYAEVSRLATLLGSKPEDFTRPFGEADDD